MIINQHHLDEVKRLRAAGCTWRETADACRLSVHIVRRLMDRGLLPDRRKSYKAGSRNFVDVDGRRRTLRALSIDWLARFKPELDRTDDAIYMAVKILRRRIADGWPAKIAITRPPGERLEEVSPLPPALADYDPPPAQVIGPPILPEPHPSELLVVQIQLQRLI